MSDGKQLGSYRSFTEKERSILFKLVKNKQKEMEELSWDEIAECFPEKTARQCRICYAGIIANDKKPMTKEEDKILLERVEEIGESWSTIAKFFPDRTPKGLKNRYKFIKKQQSQQTLAQIQNATDDLEDFSIFDGFSL